MKVVKTAAIVVGAVAAIATGVGALAGISVIAGIGMGTFSAISAGAALVSTGLNIISPPKGPKFGSATHVGSQTDVQLNSNAGIPYAMGRTLYAGTLVHQDTFGTANAFLASVLVWSGAGPIEQIESFEVDRTAISFSSGSAVGALAGYMWLDDQVGGTPESAALTSSQGTVPGWDASSQLSGFAAGLLTLKFDTNGKVFAGGFPQIGAVLKGVKIYDPREDSTYPGGSGSQRSDDESTWAYSENPWLHALTFAIGRHQNGKRVFGVGMPIDSIDVARFVEAANVADANDWKIGGVISSLDDKWQALKLMCQAGGGEPVRLGGMLSCDFETPRVSLATVNSEDLIGEGRVVATQSRRDRFNTAIPRYRSEAHGWEIVSANQISVSTYVSEDGDTRTREVDFPLVQDLNQAAELATYSIVNAREFGPITLPLKLKWIGYKPGDCLTLSIDELGLAGQTAVLRRRTLDPESGVVTQELRSETAAKHPFALGTTGTAPTTPSLVPNDLSTVAAPAEGVWTLTGTSFTSSTGSVPALVITGALDNPNAEAVIFQYRPFGNVTWSNPDTNTPDVVRKEITSVTPATQYEVAVSYKVRGVVGAKRILGPATTGALTGNYTWIAYADSANGSTNFTTGDRGARTYIGLAFNKGTATESTTASDYAWAQIQGTAGQNSALVFIFRRASSTPTLPSATTTYTFSTGVITGLNNGWTQAVPAGTDPLYVSTASAVSTGTTDTIASGEWASPVIHAQNGSAGSSGTDGLNAATVYLYQRNGTGTPPSVPSVTTTYTFATGALSGINNGWSQTVPSDAGGAFLYVTTATALGTGSTDTIATGEWATVRTMAKNGINGNDGIDGIDGEDGKWIEFVWKRAATIPATPSGNGIPTGWDDEPPAGSLPLWMSKSKQELDGTIIINWSTPIRHDGPPGADGVDGISPIVVVPGPAAITFQAEPGGAFLVGQFPYGITNTAYQGTGTVSITDVDIVSTSGCTASVSGTGVNITFASALEGHVTYNVTAAGQTVQIKVTFVTSRAGGSGAVSSTKITTTPQINWTSYTAHGQNIAINASSTGKLAVNLTGNYKSAINTEIAIQSKIQYRPAGGTWVDVSGSENTGTTTDSAVDPDRALAGHIQSTGPYTITGLTAGEPYEVRMMNRKASGDATTTASLTITLYAEQMT